MTRVIKWYLTLGLILAGMTAQSAHAAFDGTGTFDRLYNWETDKANGINVRADRMDAEMDGMATGLSTCVTKDGQTTLTDNLPMATFKFTNVGNATSADQYTAANQVRDGTLCSGSVGGSANTYTFQRTIPGSSYVTGTVVYLNPPATNTAASTLNLDTLGAKSIYKGSMTELQSGDLISDTIYPLYFDGTAFQVLGSVVPSYVTPTLLLSGTTSIQVISGTTTNSTASISFTVAGTNVASFTSNTLNVSGSVSTTQGITAQGISASSMTLTGNLLAPVVSTTGTTGTVTSTFINAKALSATTINIGAGATLSATGSAPLPGGLILKWGTFTSSAATNGTVSNVNFGTAFPTACVSVNVSANALGNSSPAWATAYNYSTSGFSSLIGNTANASSITAWSYTAVGY